MLQVYLQRLNTGFGATSSSFNQVTDAAAVLTSPPQSVVGPDTGDNKNGVKNNVYTRGMFLLTALLSEGELNMVRLASPLSHHARI